MSSSGNGQGGIWKIRAAVLGARPVAILLIVSLQDGGNDDERSIFSG
jgi:hypothetical protein